MQCGVWGPERGQCPAASEAHLGPACTGQRSGWGGVLQAEWGGTGFLSSGIQKNCKWVFKATLQRHIRGSPSRRGSLRTPSSAPVCFSEAVVLVDAHNRSFCQPSWRCRRFHLLVHRPLPLTTPSPLVLILCVSGGHPLAAFAISSHVEGLGGEACGVSPGGGGCEGEVSLETQGLPLLSHSLGSADPTAWWAPSRGSGGT